MITADRLTHPPDVRIAPPAFPIARAVLRALAYADVFEYPLTAAQAHRYLIGEAAAFEAVQAALDGVLLPGGWVEQRGEMYMLAGRGHLAALRQARARQAAVLWPRARRYGGWLARLPFVRMAAVTGALAMNNEPGRDLDFLVVTQPGRLWLCRGLAMLLVRLARRLGDELCPNYFITTRALVFPGQNLYAAHELAQMAPLHGRTVYTAIRRANAWADTYLPNASGCPTPLSAPLVEPPGRRWLETALRSAPGDWLEDWEMRRKVRKLTAQRQPQAEADFGPDWCKGHFGGYGHRALDAYHARLNALGL